MKDDRPGQCAFFHAINSEKSPDGIFRKKIRSALPAHQRLHHRRDRSLHSRKRQTHARASHRIQHPLPDRLRTHRRQQVMPVRSQAWIRKHNIRLIVRITLNLHPFDQMPFQQLQQMLMHNSHEPVSNSLFPQMVG